MKIKILMVVMCFFIMTFGGINTSIAQSITPSETTVEMYQGATHETELTVNTNGYRVINRWYISSDPFVVNVVEINFYSLTNNIFG
ncbi:hypothetical protein [Butyricimonas synergistica]|uniref:hypothetical protein n=1 Tax=Butyricimonas synergistica TaxID=544644 RepID=UPI000373CA05|nr:hypothetical protein [Butyricimonas synergistica]